jgi:hypothetical protein
MSETFATVEAVSLEATVTEHLEYLGVFWYGVSWSGGEASGGMHTLTLLFKGQLSLFIVILILSTTPVFTTLFLKSVDVIKGDCMTAYLSLVLRHVCCTFPLSLALMYSCGYFACVV